MHVFINHTLLSLALHELTRIRARAVKMPPRPHGASWACAVVVVLCCVAAAPPAAADPIMWSGGVTPTSAQLRLQVGADGDTILVSAASDLSSPVFELGVDSGIQAANVTGLMANTKYYYGLRAAAAANPELVGTFTTHQDGVFSYSVAFASCAYTGYESGVFNEIADRDPLFFIHMGDLHYENIDNANVAVRDQSYHDVFASGSQVSARASPLSS